jgi:hypothetical protein
MEKDLPYILVHGDPRDCPRAHAAFEITKALAAKVKRDPFCMAGGKPALRAVKKATE